MMQAYCIWIVTPEHYLHSRCFEEVALSLREAFDELGYDAPVVTNPAQITGRPIVLGANLLPNIGGALPNDMILYNLEQVQEDSVWINGAYMALLKAHPVWDYSERNITALKAMGVADITLCGIGYMPGLTRIAGAPKDIDVLFVGSTNDRRLAVLNALAATGVKVVAGYNCYGAERDALIARAHIVINLHFYEAQLFEIVRVSYLLANRICVVSETGNDSGLEASLASAIAFAPYDGLVETCKRLLADPQERARVAQNGFDRFRTMSQVPMLQHALDAQA